MNLGNIITRGGRAGVVDPDPDHFCNLDPHSDPHDSDKLDPEPDPDPHQIADDKAKRMEYEPILTLFQGFGPLFGS
jgi:hypothetical protein